MPDINLVDSSLKNYYEHTEISIQLNLSGFSFCIVSEKDRKLRAFRSYSFNDVILQEDLLKKVKEILQKDELLRLPHRNTKVIYFSQKSTLVPKAYCKDEYLKKILQFNHPLDDLDEIHQQPISGCSSNLIFTIHTYIASVFTEKFKNCDFYNQAVPFLNYFLNTSSEKTEIFVQLNKDFYEIAVIAGKNLQLYNSFLFSSETDMIYFLLYICKQLHIGPESTPLTYLGELASVTKLEKEISRYFPLAKRIENKSICFPKLPLAIPNAFRYYSLLNMAICE